MLCDCSCSWDRSGPLHRAIQPVGQSSLWPLRVSVGHSLAGATEDTQNQGRLTSNRDHPWTPQS